MHFIGGIWVEGGSHRFTSLNPATGEAIWHGHAAASAQVAAAVSAAHAAFPGWAGCEYAERLAIIDVFKSRIDASREELAALIARETGKVLWDARSEAAAVVAKLGFTTDAYQERTGHRSRPSPVGSVVLNHRPHGVMAVFGPYNFPAHLPNGHIMPALLAGNTVVFKPSEHTPLVAEWMVKLWEKAGIPAGVINLVQGERDTGIALAADAVDGILFTGSSATGKALHTQMAGKPEVMLALEMGGNNPLIVGAVADIRAAVHETLLSAFIGSGQRCTCARRLILIDSPNANAYLDMLLSSARNLTVGAYDEEPSPFMGPLISMREANRLVEAQENLERLGGRVLLRMESLRPGLPFLSPSIIDVTGVSHVPDMEYFGPLLQLYRVQNEREAIAIANGTNYGLSASVICDEQAVFQQLSKNIRAGLINWNRQTTGASGAGPFGGIGLSGNHRPAGYYSADYCAYPVASVENNALQLPEQLPPGMRIE